MTVRIRLARHGQKNTPFYHIVRPPLDFHNRPPPLTWPTPHLHLMNSQVAINGRNRREALPIEKLGEYDPIPRIPRSPFHPDLSSLSMRGLFANGPVPGVQPEKKIVWNTERIKWWLANGAQPSETVVKLLEKVRVWCSRGFFFFRKPVVY